MNDNVGRLCSIDFSSSYAFLQSTNTQQKSQQRVKNKKCQELHVH